MSFFKNIIGKISFFVFALLFFYSCDNIFAPKIDNTPTHSIITDQTTIEGLFQNFKYSYTFKDTSVYSNLLTDDFIFTYRNYVSGYDESWDKPTEVLTTTRLFNNSQKCEVVWNNIINQYGDSIQYFVKRSFNLAITFNPSDIIRINGFADMTLTKSTSDNKWRLKKWRDESF